MNDKEKLKEEYAKYSFHYVEWKEDTVVVPKNLGHYNHLLFILEGDIEVYYGSLNPKKIAAGNMILLSSLANYKCKIVTFAKVVVLTFDKLAYGCNQFAYQDLTPIFTLIKYEFQELIIRQPVRQYLNLIIKYLEKDMINKELFWEKVKELSVLFDAYYDAEEITMLCYPILGVNMEFKKLVTDNYSKVKNAAEYAELCGFSLGVFQRKFKEVFGETIYQWMQRQKAEQIKHRLTVSDINPKELAEEFDFASPAHLNKFCKIWFGMTPTELRQTYLLKKNLK